MRLVAVHPIAGKEKAMVQHVYACPAASDEGRQVTFGQLRS